jgi:hypothetical protein
MLIAVAGLSVLFLSHLSKQIIKHDEKIKEFDEKLNLYERRGSAIIPYNENPKRSFFHAKIKQFYTRDVYENDNINEETIDMLNDVVYQDLILSPSYLEYFFRRTKKSKKSIKVVIVSYIDEGLCAYLTLCIMAGYEVFIIDQSIYSLYMKKMSKKVNGDFDLFEIMYGSPYFVQCKIEQKFGFIGKCEALRDGCLKDVEISQQHIEKLWPLIKDMLSKYADQIFSSMEISPNRIEGILSGQKKRDLNVP